jgi:hypothetical protein
VATARAAGVQLNPDALHDLSAGACAHAAAAARECLAVPCLAQLREQDMERVAAALSGWHISEST